MPKLSEIVKVVSRKLDVSGVTIQLQDTLTWAQQEELEAIEDGLERGDRTLQMIFKGWDATDDDGNVLEFTNENLGYFPRSDVLTLMRYVMTDLVRARNEEELKNNEAMKALHEEALRTLERGEAPEEQTVPQAAADTDTNVGVARCLGCEVILPGRHAHDCPAVEKNPVVEAEQIVADQLVNGDMTPQAPAPEIIG